MVSLRRVSLPLKGTDRLRRAVFKPRPPRMGRAERKLEEALNQLRNGVPLNWLQLEDDPELVTLARLYGVARQAYRPGTDSLPPHLQEDVLERMGKRLPPPKQQPVKQAPRSLAGFSENVPVLTQVEDDLPPLATTAPQMIASTFVTALVVTLLAVAYNTFFPAPRSPYTWIEVRQNGSLVSAPNLPRGYKTPNCPAWTTGDTAPYVTRRYLDIPPDKAQENVDFPLRYLPDSVMVGDTYYGVGLMATAVAPCDELGSVPYSSARLSYLVRSNSSPGSFQLGQLSVFYARQQVAPVDSAGGTFKQVTIGDYKGVFWEGESYKDYSGTLWLGQGPISMLVLENGDLVTTFVGPKEKGITEEMLAALVRKMYGINSTADAPQAGPTSTPQSNVPLPLRRKYVPR